MSSAVSRLRPWRSPAALCVVAALFLAVIPLAAQAPDPILQAMREELDRSRKLAVPQLDKPYYIEYAIEDADNYGMSATLGGMVSQRHDRFRIPEVNVRVGSYEFDNTNYIFSGMRFSDRLPLETLVPVLRRYLWIETDSAYKAALQAMSRKRAALRNLTAAEAMHDFARAQPLDLVLPASYVPVDENAWAARVRALSSVFVDFPKVRDSGVEFQSVQATRYFVNTEGTQVRFPDSATFLTVRAQAQASDGMVVHDALVFQARNPLAMPLDPELRRGAAAVAANVTALAGAARGEFYSGPVLFEGVAAAQIFAEVLGRNFSIFRRPVMEPGRPGSFPTSELEGRQGARILPEWMDVVDDPTQKEWRGRPLFGSYEVDREGVRAVPVPLVEKGVLKGFLLTRQPVRGMEGSNGRARLPGNFGANTAAIGNLFVRAREMQSLAAMKRKLIEICNTRGKPYGMLVRRMDFPSSAGMDEVRRLLTSQQGSTRPVSLPLMIYKIFPDGREELVRGVRFRSLNTRSLKDILMAGDDETIFEFLENGAPFALMGAGNYVAESCVVAPSVLLDDIEVAPLEDESPKLPVVPPPDMAH